MSTAKKPLPPGAVKVLPASVLRNMIIITSIIIVILLIILIVIFILYSQTNKNLNNTLNPDGTCKPQSTANLV